MRYLKKLSSLLCNKESFNYNPEAKEHFKKTGIKAMKELAKLLKLKVYDVNFNPGGIAVSGDLHLMGMWNDKNGIHIFMNKDFPTSVPAGQIVYRTIKHMKDFSGGINNSMLFEDLASETKLKSLLLHLRGEKE